MQLEAFPKFGAGCMYEKNIKNKCIIEKSKS